MTEAKEIDSLVIRGQENINFSPLSFLRLLPSSFKQNAFLYSYYAQKVLPR
jgi:hypothetical protein